jgi:hypothetical protein
LELSLTFNDNGTSHGDVLLRFAGQEWVCDSYYFAIDDETHPEAEDALKVRAVLKRLLEQWLAAVQVLKIDEHAYLPYDFSDQYTGWLRCTRIQAGFRVVQGWSSVEGWSFSPTAVGGLLHQLEGFRAKGPSMTIGANELEDAIRASTSSAA